MARVEHARVEVAGLAEVKSEVGRLLTNLLRSEESNVELQELLAQFAADADTVTGSFTVEAGNEHGAITAAKMMARDSGEDLSGYDELRIRLVGEKPTPRWQVEFRKFPEPSYELEGNMVVDGTGESILPPISTRLTLPARYCTNRNGTVKCSRQEGHDGSHSGDSVLAGGPIMWPQAFANPWCVERHVVTELPGEPTLTCSLPAGHSGTHVGDYTGHDGVEMEYRWPNGGTATAPCLDVYTTSAGVLLGCEHAAGHPGFHVSEYDDGEDDVTIRWNDKGQAMPPRKISSRPS